MSARRLKAQYGRRLKVHYGPCGAARAPIIITCYPESVTCLVCLYHLGRYVPLSKLREHQHRERSADAVALLSSRLF